MKMNIRRSPKTSAPAPSKPTPATTKSDAKQSIAQTRKATSAVATAPAVKELRPLVIAPQPETMAITTIVAQIDIGFGNTLYIRGEGAGLSWEKGLPMGNLSADQWRVLLGKTTAPITFKFLINDLTWSSGEDYKVEPGETVTIVPQF